MPNFVLIALMGFGLVLVGVGVPQAGDQWGWWVYEPQPGWPNLVGGLFKGLGMFLTGFGAGLANRLRTE